MGHREVSGMRFDTTPHFRSITTRNQREAYRMWLLKRERRGDPSVCWGMYRWLAQQGIEKHRREFVAWRIGNPSPHRKRPLWCSRTMWDSWRKFQREYRGNITLDEYRDRRDGKGEKEAKFFARPKVGSVLERPVSDILAKFGRLGLLPKAKT